MSLLFFLKNLERKENFNIFGSKKVKNCKKFEHRDFYQMQNSWRENARFLCTIFQRDNDRLILLILFLF